MTMNPSPAVPLPRCLGLLPAVLLLAGCASVATPPGTVSETAKQELKASFDASVKSINTALAAKQDAPAETEVVNQFVRSGMALADIQCKDYFKRLGHAAQQYSFGRKELGLASGTVAGLQGLTGVSAKVVAITASMFSFGIASTENYADAFLFSPEVSGVQQLVESSQAAYRAAIPPLDGLPYGDAISLLRAYDALCEVQTIRRLVNESIATAEPVASKPDAVVTAARAAGMPERQLHVERFDW